MRGPAACALALALVTAVPAPTLAQRGGGNRPTGGGGTRTTAPVQRAAPVSRPAPPPRPTPPVQGGFNFNHDIVPRRPPVPQRPVAPPQRPVGPPQRPIAPPQRPVAPPQRPVAPNYPHAPFNAGNGPYHGQFHGRPVPNPQHWNGSWGWNHGVVWRPAPTYWGGGFWGPFAIGALTGALLFGSIVDYQQQVIYPSYRIEPDSPGEQLLQNYGLQQTPCGPPNLVVIWGPDNSVICAFPNDLVAPGNYELDPTTLTIVSQAP